MDFFSYGYQPKEEVTDYRTLKELILEGGKKGGDKKQYAFEVKGKTVEKTFADVLSDEEKLGAYMYSIGLDGGKKVAILSRNSYEWCLAYYTVLVGGNVVVPLDTGLDAKELAHQIRHCGCTGIFCSREMEDVLNDITGKYSAAVDKVLFTDDFPEYEEKGAALPDEVMQRFLDYPVAEKDLACIVYTSGTTGRTKGVMLSHRGVAANAVASCKNFKGGHGLGFLPLNHTYSWVAGLFATFLKGEWGFICTNLFHIYSDISKYKPHNFAAVPMAVEMIYKKIISDAKLQGRYDDLMRGIETSRNFMLSGLDRRRELFSNIHEALGGNLEYIICGGAHLKTEVEEFMYDIGIQIITGYGLTECSPCVTASQMYDFKFGSVGLALDCNEIKISDPDEDGIGEIYVKGENVMLGYYGDPEATASVMDGEWFKTGDLGYIDEEGFLFFTGRKKNLIILSNGKNVSPEEMEDIISENAEFVKELVIYGENDRICGEFLLDEENFPDARELLPKYISEFNASQPDFRRIAVIKIRETEFDKTTTLKIKRYAK